VLSEAMPSTTNHEQNTALYFFCFSGLARQRELCADTARFNVLKGDQVIRDHPANRATEASAESSK